MDIKFLFSCEDNLYVASNACSRLSILVHHLWRSSSEHWHPYIQHGREEYELMEVMVGVLRTSGSEIVVADSPAGRLGLTVCYDLRFPEIYQRLRFTENSQVRFCRV